MSKHTIAEAETRLAKLVEKALRGEEVVLTRDGAPLVELRPVADEEAERKRRLAESLDWLDQRRRKPRLVGDAAELVSRMRDEDWR